MSRAFWIGFSTGVATQIVFFWHAGRPEEITHDRG